MPSPFACALVNGHCLVKASLHDEQGVGESVYADPNMWCSGPQMNVVFYSPNIVQQQGVQWQGVLWLDDYAVELGAVDKRRQNASVSIPLKFFPQTLRLEVRRCTSAQTSVESVETAICDCIVAILGDPVRNPRQGSLELSTVTSQVQEREPHLFNILKESAPESYQKLVHGEQERFSVFSYSENEIKDRKMEGHVEAGQPRVVLKQRSSLQFYEEEEEQHLMQYLKGALEKKTYVCDDLLMKLSMDSKDDTFAYPLCPVFSLLMRFLRRNTHLFSWSTDPNQVTMISLKPQGAAQEPPAKGHTLQGNTVGSARASVAGGQVKRGQSSNTNSSKTNKRKVKRSRG